MQLHTQAATITPITTFHIQIARKPDVFRQFGFGNTHLHNLINKGLMPPSINLGGARSVGFLQHELDQVLAFMVADRSKDDIRALVSHLVDQRKKAAEGIGHE